MHYFKFRTEAKSISNELDRVSRGPLVPTSYTNQPVTVHGTVYLDT